MGHFQNCMNVKIPVPKRLRVLKNSVVKFYIPAVWYMLLLEEDYFGKISKKTANYPVLVDNKGGGVLKGE